MASLRCTLTRWVDDRHPGWVEVRFTDSDDGLVVLTDKVPVFGVDVGPDTPLPVPVAIDCEVVRRERDQRGRELVVVVLGHGVEDDDGNCEFRVVADLVRSELD